ncbi:MAG: SpoIID/LytB domain-containing protein [Marmoricola sp.]
MGRRPLLRPRRAIPALVAVAALAAGALGAAAVAPADANVSVNEVYTIPTSGTAAGRFTILWRGNGHGHGLSQYGAQVAAEKGLTASQILAFYYPGTSHATATGNMRVRLSAAPRDSLQVAPTSSLTVVDTGNGNASYALPSTVGGVAVKQWRLGVNSAGKTVVAYLQSSWKNYKTLVGDGKFVDSKLGYVTLLNPSTKKYRGALLAASTVKGDLHRTTVNVVGVEQYVNGVVPSEMSPSWPTAALQAQATAARTYALFERAEHTGSYYDICDTTMCQVYGGMGAEAAASNQAVAATKGSYLSYGGKPAFTQFSASNGGWESYGGYPYLPSKLDPYTPTAEEVYGRSYSWSKPNTPVAPLQNAYPSIGTLKSVTITSREGGTGAVWKGRVMSMILTGTRGSVGISGGSFAAIFGLSSTWFTLQVAAPTSAKPTTYTVGTHVKPGWSSSMGQPIGPEVSATVSGVVGYYQKFPKGYALINSKFGTYKLNGSILQKWSPGAIGWPTSAMTSQTVFGVQGWVQRFQNGRALIASSYGAFASNGSIFSAWRPAQRGWPTANLSSTVVHGRTGWLQTFRKGSTGSDYAFAPKPSGALTWTNGAPS